MAKTSTTKATPFILNDVSRGRITPYSVSPFLVPSNSVSNCKNVNFDTFIGSAVVRPGTTLLGSVVASGRSPLGLTEFVGFSGTPNYQVAVFKGASTASLYYYDGSWHTSLTGLNNTAKCRFTMLGGRLFMVNGEQNPFPITPNSMISTSDGITWNSTNCPSTSLTIASDFTLLPLAPSLIKSYKGRLLIAGNNLTNQSKDKVFFSNVISQNPDEYSVTIASSGSTVTVTGTGLPFKQYDTITIKGANQPKYNGSFKVGSGATSTTFTYTISGTETSPATGTITASYAQLSFNTDSKTGDWIDINPDDGDTITAFGETSDQFIVFKTRAMYRLDVINKSADTSNIFNIGAVSQEAVTTCNGICYFFSGIDIRRTNGGFPEQISRLAVQDFIDAIPQSNWSSICAGNDGYNVYFSIGNVTLNQNKDEQVSYTNVVLKYSTRDEAWSVHSYAQQPLFFSQYTTSTDGRKMISADTTGSVQTFNKGLTDNGSDIFYELETQELDFGNRAHSKSVSNTIAVFGRNLQDSIFNVQADDSNYNPIQLNLKKRVNVGTDINTHDGYFMKFKWSGVTNGASPVFEGFQIEDINDEGLTTK